MTISQNTVWLGQNKMAYNHHWSYTITHQSLCMETSELLIKNNYKKKW